jgi:hypothetical protein
MHGFSSPASREAVDVMVGMVAPPRGSRRPAMLPFL